LRRRPQPPMEANASSRFQVWLSVNKWKTMSADAIYRDDAGMKQVTTQWIISI
jgi:hypothetical protein